MQEYHRRHCIPYLLSDVRMGNVLFDMDAVYDHGIVHEIRIMVWT